MSVARQIRDEVEFALAQRVPSALSPRQETVRERLASGVLPLDCLLNGGVPIGAVSELIGPSGSGRTTMSLAYAAAVAREGRVVAWIDASDALDPTSAALNGLDLARLLWVRCPCETLPAAEMTRPIANRDTDVFVPVRGNGSPHPRSEASGMSEAISAVLAHGELPHQTRRERKVIGTPGMPNRPLSRVTNREEQTPTDRQPSRRAQVVAQEPRCAEPQPHRSKLNHESRRKTVARVPVVPVKSHGKPSVWTALDSALRCTDLLLQSGGFGLIVLDLGDVPLEKSSRIPLATWFRYRAACKSSRTGLLLLTRYPCAGSSAELVVRLQTGALEANRGSLLGFNFKAEVERQRFFEPLNVVAIRKPPQSERLGMWKGRAAWAI